MDNDKYYTPNQIAEKLQLKPVTVRRMLQEGALAGHKVGGVWRISERDFDAYMRETRNIEKQVDTEH